MTNREIIYEYEQTLIDKKKNIDSEIFCYNDYGNEKLVIQIFKYAIENIMHWTPKEAYYGLNDKIINLLKLKYLVRYIQFPPEFDPNEDYFFIVSRIYPDRIKVNIKEKTLIMYQRLLSDKLKKFPKRFLEGRDGEMRAVFCLKYAIQNYGTFGSIEDLYRAFSSSEGSDFLKRVKLYLPCTTLFDCPIDFLHASFSKSEQMNNEFIYTLYKFKVYEREQIRKNKLKGKQSKVNA